MVRSRAFSSVCVTLICLAIFAMPANGAHLHLCLDGNEPPSSLHLTVDADHHNEPGAQATHNDLDVSLRAEATVKKNRSLLGLPPLIAASFILFSMPAAGSIAAPVPREAINEPAPVRFVLPPLRAPPA